MLREPRDLLRLSESTGSGAFKMSEATNEHRPVAIRIASK